MSDQPEEAIRATIYPTMWLPTLAWGIPRDYALFVVLVAVFAMWFVAVFIDLNASRIVGLVIGLIMWVGGGIAAHYDPEFFGVRLCEIFQIGRTKNKGADNEYLA